jgi:hypothetical protein
MMMMERGRYIFDSPLHKWRGAGGEAIAIIEKNEVYGKI